MALVFHKRLKASRSVLSSPSLVRQLGIGSNSNRDYDMIVIGGGSGGLACSKEAAQLGRKVAVLDYVLPSPQGTSWGLGGTCVNVGCIPKKLMHQAALLHSAMRDSPSYGWTAGNTSELSHDWNTLVTNVRHHILSLNWGHRVQLKEKKVDYYNCFGSFVDNHTIQATDKNGKQTLLTADNIVIAIGGRPAFPDQVPGAKEFGISSDDIFFLQKPPGRTLVIGGSYVALECGGFLNGLGHHTSVMIRSRPLKSFDEHVSKLVVDHMESEGVEFIRGCTPVRVDKIRSELGETKLVVTYSNNNSNDDNNSNNIDQEIHKVAVDTVLFATGRRAATTDLKLDRVGIQTDVTTSQIPVDDHDATSAPNVFVIGDAALGRPELTPVAIMSGKLLAKRLYSNSTQLMNYEMVPTTVFTPLEYGSVGLTERQAVDRFGEDNVEVFHAFYKPLEYYLPSRDSKQCYIKVVCSSTDSSYHNRVVGLHITGPNAGEITQGFAVAIKRGISILDLQSTVGIHPTIAEEVVKLHITKSSGEDPTVSAC